MVSNSHRIKHFCSKVKVIYIIILVLWPSTNFTLGAPTNMFGVSMDSLWPPHQHLMDRFWIQIIRIKKSGSQKSYFWCKWLPFKPGWPQMVIFWMLDHPDPEIWEKSGLLKITFLVLMASLNPWLTPNGYSFDTRSPRWGSRPNIWKKSGSQKVIFWCSLLCLTPARHLMVIFLDARWKYLDDNFKI